MNKKNQFIPYHFLFNFRLIQPHFGMGQLKIHHFRHINHLLIKISFHFKTKKQDLKYFANQKYCFACLIFLHIRLNFKFKMQAKFIGFGQNYFPSNLIS